MGPKGINQGVKTEVLFKVILQELDTGKYTSDLFRSKRGPTCASSVSTAIRQISQQYLFALRCCLPQTHMPAAT